MVTADKILFVRCYAELNEFLPLEHRYNEFPLLFSEPFNVAKLLDRLNIPLNSVEIILVDGKSVSAKFSLSEGNRISLYPIFESFDIRSLLHLHSAPLRHIKFIADVHLGKLARYLRLFGFDTAYNSSFSFSSILSIAELEQRCILSKSIAYKEKPSVTKYFHIQSSIPEEQLTETFSRFDLWLSSKPFTRCLKCNTLLVKRSIDNVNKNKIPPRILTMFNEYMCCSSCQQYYWKGSHYKRMEEFIGEFLRPCSMKR